MIFWIWGFCRVCRIFGFYGFEKICDMEIVEWEGYGYGGSWDWKVKMWNWLKAFIGI
jgi:hypothetical protein